MKHFRPMSFWKPNGFNPATLNLTGWWRGSYGGAPWTPTASAGSSGSNGNLVVGTAPSVGTAQGGFTPAAFNGTTQFLQSANAPATFLALGASSIVCLAYIVSAPATSGTSYLDPNLVATSTSVEVGMTFSSSGYVAHIFDGAHEDTAAIAFSTGAYHLFQMTWDSANLKARIDGGSVTSQAAGAIDTFAPCPQLQVGQNYNGTAFANARIMEIMTAQTAFSVATLDNIRSYCNTRYGVSV